MDSNTSGSMQSSSGGDEEYDSRPESVLPSFLNPTSSHHFNPQASLLTLHHHHQQQQQQHPTLFDPSPNFFHAFSQSPPPQNNPNPNLLNLDVVRSQGLQGSSAAAASSSSQSIMGAYQGTSSSHPINPSMQLRSVQDNAARSSSPSDHHTHVVTRNPKKRTRASRRAPTTVLTTDTSNFRAMVQEFTGIPAPPFSGSPYSRRLDLFGPAGSPLYPLRPSAQKVHQQSPFVPSLSSSSSSFLNNTIVDATNIASTTTTSTNNNINNSIGQAATNTFNPISINYDQLGLQKQPIISNMQNQMFSFQSLLQPSPLLPSLNVPSLSAKSQVNLPLTSLDELGMSSHGDHHHVNANLGGLLTSQVTTTQGMQLRINESNQDHHLRTSFDGQRLNSTCKLNYSASSSSEFHHHHDRGLDNVVSARGEGTVDSWICPEINEAK